MATLSDADRRYVQAMTGLDDSEAVIEDDLLDDFYTRIGENLDGTIAMIFEAIAADNAKLVTYSNGLQSENLSDLFDHLLKLADRWWTNVSASNQFRNVNLRAAPKVWREQPADWVDPSRRSRLAGFPPWGRRN